MQGDSGSTSSEPGPSAGSTTRPVQIEEIGLLELDEAGPILLMAHEPLVWPEVLIAGDLEEDGETGCLHLRGGTLPDGQAGVIWPVASSREASGRVSLADGRTLVPGSTISTGSGYLLRSDVTRQLGHEPTCDAEVYAVVDIVDLEVQDRK